VSPLTASGLDRAEACPLSLVLPHAVDVAPREHRDRGTAIHRFLKDIADGVPRATAIAQAPEDFRADCEAVDLDAMPHTAGQWRAEVPLAYHPAGDSGRELPSKGERDYSAALPGEIPGTADLVGLTPDAVVVLDVKTGRAPLGEPGTALQLLHNALALCRLHGRSIAVVGWVKLLSGQPRFETATLGAEELRAAAERLRAVQSKALEAELAHMADPDAVTPVLGEHCRYCPAWFRCPAQMTLAATVTRAALGQESMSLEVPRERRGEFITFVHAVESFTDRLIATANAMATEEPILLPNGKVYSAEVETREYLDPLMTQQVLGEISPGLAADVVATKLTASKQALSDAAQKHLPLGQKKQAWVTSLLATLREKGAAFERSSVVVKARKPKSSPAAALNSGGGVTAVVQVEGSPPTT
jgi:hypothetical protein